MLQFLALVPTSPRGFAGLDTCSNGVTGIEGMDSDGNSVCCSSDCLNDDGEPQCGGRGCGRRGGGSADCCVGEIVEEGESCASKGSAPCFIG